MQQNFTDYCAELVRQRDQELFLIALSVPRKNRYFLWPIFALQTELDRIPKVVSNPILGRIRLQWWHDTIERMFQNKIDAHLVIQELHQQKQDFWREEYFHTLISAHEFELEDTEFSLQDFKQYLNDLSIPLLRLCCPNADQAVLENIAVAFSLSRIFRRSQPFEQDDIVAALEGLKSIQRANLPKILRLFHFVAQNSLERLLVQNHKSDYLLALKMALFA